MNNRLVNFTKKNFNISKYLACNAEKTLRLKITKKNKYRKICIYVDIYVPSGIIYILCVAKITQNKNESINSIH